MTSEVLSAPLSETMEIIINIRFMNVTWKQCVRIDLINWEFVVIPYAENSLPLPIEIIVMLLTSFAIKKEDDQKPRRPYIRKWTNIVS
ncbi:hypothetical protein ACI2OX_19900 [Bacillus sp. N9]